MDGSKPKKPRTELRLGDGTVADLMWWWIGNPGRTVLGIVKRDEADRGSDVVAVEARFGRAPMAESAASVAAAVVVLVAADTGRDGWVSRGVTVSEVKFGRGGAVASVPRRLIAPLPGSTLLRTPSFPERIDSAAWIPVLEKYPWDLFDACAGGGRSLTGFADGECAFASAAAQLVALGVCDSGAARVAKHAYVAVAEAAWGGVRTFECEHSFLRALAATGAGPTANRALSLPIYAQSGAVDAYVLDRARHSFFRLSDNLEISQPSADWDLLHAVLAASKHRNATAHKDAFVLAMPSAYGFARQALGCQRCALHLPPCPFRSIPILGASRTALLTCSDLKGGAVAALVAARKYDHMVSQGTFKTRGRGLAALYPLRETLAERAAQIRDGEMRKSNNMPPDVVEAETEARAKRVEEMLSCSRGAFQAAYRMPEVASLVLDERFAKSAAEFEAVFAKRPIAGALNRVDAGKSSRDKYANASATTAADGPYTLTVPGYEELRGGEWSLDVLRPWMPPCLALVVDACFKNRHPLHPERNLVGSFMCHIEGLARDEDAFFAAWTSLFRHPEPTCVLHGDRAENIEKSEYGRVMTDSIRHGFARGKCFACAYAVKCKLCPFSLETSQCKEKLKTVLGASDGALAATFAANNAPDAVSKARTLCMNYLRAAHGEGSGQVCVSSPWWFYNRARKPR